jgi:tRNA(adenine34) deaminase
MLVEDRFMREALKEARLARAAGEVPVGAVVVLDGRVVGRGHNASLALHDPSAHAEVLAMRDAAARLRNYRLVEATLYCTVEPCLMCLGTAIHARVSQLVYGASDLKVGAVGRLETLRVLGAEFNHRVAATGGVLAEDASALLLEFFRERREAARAGNVESITERYRSGRNGGASKALCPGDRARGFESHPLRHLRPAAAVEER